MSNEKGKKKPGRPRKNGLDALIKEKKKNQKKPQPSIIKETMAEIIEPKERKDRVFSRNRREVEKDMLPQWIKFCNEYVKEFNASKAYKAIAKPGTKDVCIRNGAANLLKDERIQKYIQWLVGKHLRDLELDGRDIISYLQTALFYDPLEFMSWNNAGFIQWKSLDDIPPEIRRLITKIKEGKNGLEIEFFSKEKALDLLAKYYNILAPQKDEGGEQKSIFNVDLKKLSDDELKILKQAAQIAEKARVNELPESTGDQDE